MGFNYSGICYYFNADIEELTCIIYKNRMKKNNVLR